MKSVLKKPIIFAVIYLAALISILLVLNKLVANETLPFPGFVFLILFSALYSFLLKAKFTHHFKGQASGYITIFDLMGYFLYSAIRYFYLGQPMDELSSLWNEFSNLGLIVSTPPFITAIIVAAVFIFGTALIYVMNYFLIHLGNWIALIFMKNKNTTDI